MRIVVSFDAEGMGAAAAADVAGLVARQPGLVLGMAAGRTPVGLYRALAARAAAGLDFSGVFLFGLDEYVGLPPEHPARFRRAVESNLAGLRTAGGLWPEVRPGADIPAACAGFETAIAARGGIDLQILGIGANGHIGFNEPGSSLGGRTRLVRLSSATRAANRSAFGSIEEVPEAAITQGIGTILAAKRIVLLADGAAKAAAVAAAVEGPLSASVPASALQLHPDATLYLDEAAAADLSRLADYKAEENLRRRLGCRLG